MNEYRTFYAPVGGFLVYLARGWMLPDPVDVMKGHHGTYSILLRHEGKEETTW